MDFNKDKFELVEKYLANRLSEEESRDFENRYQNDTAFAKEIDKYRTEIESVKKYGDQVLKEKFEKRFENMSQKRTGKVVQLRRSVLAIAAVILILLIALPLGYWYFNSQTTMTELYVENFEPVSFSSFRDTAVNGKEAWLKARRYYENSDFEQSAEILKTMISNPEFARPSEANLYLGICHLKLKKPMDAISNFNAISPESAFMQDADWFIALAYLKLEDKRQATISFELMANDPNHFYQKKATEILEDLR
jgi:hypothetical protein